MVKRVSIGQASEFPKGKMKTVNVKGTFVLVVRIDDDTVCAVKNQCSHMSLPLSNGNLEDDTLTCPWHNSKFNICTGENIDWVRGVVGVKLPKWSRDILSMGQQPKGLTTYTVVEQDGRLFVEI